MKSGILLTVALCAALLAPAHAARAEEAGASPVVPWTFASPLGTFDRASLQRGFQVYKEVCSSCHSLNRVAYRNLAALGYSPDEIKAVASEAVFTDEVDDAGNAVERKGRPSDHFKAPFANEAAARAANGGALPPDLSLIVRAREGGADYVFGLLTGFAEPPAGFKLAEGKYYNLAFPGHAISMPAPLSKDAVAFADGTSASVEQMSKDVTAFLAWASDPSLEARKQTGVKAVLFLALLCGLMYATKKRVWRHLH